MVANPSVLVIGGGSTGCGIARDLAMRGLEVTLLEKGNLTNGTTGRMHGLLHSGARYAVADPTSGAECIAENRILRDIASHCVEPTGGLFVKRPEDSDEYFETKLEACRDCDISTEVLSADAARDREPYLATDIDRAIAVPDAAVDPFRLCVANAASAENHGARIETHAEVTDLVVEAGEVVGATVDHTDGGATEVIRADHVINATGAWANQLGEMAGVDVGVRQSKGVMTVTNVRQVDTVINRCAPKSNADILVPHETTAILGTTDEEVADPEDYPEEQWEVDLLIDELSKLLPILQEARTLRSYWGVRPLYEPAGRQTADSEDVTRRFFLLDHADRDAVPGLTSIVGGKFTTYRRMAEAVSDHVCAKLGVASDCRTADVSLPGSRDSGVLQEAMDRFDLTSPVARRSAQRLGDRAEAVLDTDQPNPVVCSCEAVTRAELRDAMDVSAADLHAARLRTRASMGNCQGCFCVHGMAAELYPQVELPRIRAAREDLYQERWKGQRHALWGQQLSQAMLTYALHATTMNRDQNPAGERGAIEFQRFDDGPGDPPHPGGSTGGD